MKIQTTPTKYTIGDKVWLMTDDKKILQGVIIGVNIHVRKDKPTEINYKVEHNGWGKILFTNTQLYGTKEELIKTL